MSPPLAECCLQSKAHQYLFINHKWHSPSNTDSCLIHSTLSEVYAAALQASSPLPVKTSGSNAGPLPKHYQPENLSKMHPIIILHVECSTNSYSLLNKGGNRDGNIVFHNGIDLVECINECLIPIFTKYIPQFLWTLKGNKGSGSSQCSSNSMITSTVKRKVVTQQLLCEKKALVCASLAAEEEEEPRIDMNPPRKSDIDLLFHHGFLDKQFTFPTSDPGPEDIPSDGADCVRGLDDHMKRRRVCVSRENNGESELDTHMHLEQECRDNEEEFSLQSLVTGDYDSADEVVSVSSIESSVLWTDAALGLLVPSSPSPSSSSLLLIREPVPDTFSDVKERGHDDNNIIDHGWELVDAAAESDSADAANHGTDEGRVDDVRSSALNSTVISQRRLPSFMVLHDVIPAYPPST